MTERTKISSEATMALLCCVVGSATGCGSDERQPEDPALRAAEEAPAKDSEGLAADEPFAPPQIIPEDEDTSWTVEDGLRIGHWSGRPVAAYDVGYQTSGGSAEEMASEYLHTREDLGELVHVGTHETPGGYHVRYEQRVKGHPVHRSDIVVNLDTHGVVTSVFGDASPELSVDGKGTPIDPNDALAIAKAYLKVAGAAHHEDVQLVVYRYQSRLAYAVTVVPFPTTVQFGEWEVLVDAHSGEIFRVEDQALSASGTGNVFRVDPLTSSGANYYDPGFIHDLDADTPQLTAELFGVTLQDITLAGGQYHLEGPNAVATDFWAPSVPTSQPTNNFQFTRSHDSFEAVSGYYHIDTSMRYAQSLGYNPTPYQYSGGVRFDPRVFMSVPNAYYIGSTGEIWFNGHAYNHPFVNHVETAEDAAWVLHELGHGLHDWLSGGNLSQWEGLSEGVADYWAQSYVHGEGLLPTSDPRFHWFFRWGAHDHVINFNLGRVTNYSAQYPSGLVGQVHTDGQIWSSTLMQIWSDIGKATTDTLLLETLSSVGSSSNQNDAANAFYQADLTLYGGAHIIPICNRLLQRGYTVPACSPHIVETSTGTTGGLMIDTGQTLGSDWGWDAQLADLDGDGDLDAFVCNVNGDPNKIWLNNGTGVFGLAQSLGSSDSRDVGLGDVDGDGDVDAYVINANGQADQLWFNNGAGSFANSGQLLGTQIGLSIDLGDVDGDGDLDALVGNNGPNRIWLNNGSGGFTNSGQSLGSGGSSSSFDVELGDLDGDGDLDAFIANLNTQPNRIWTNNGAGVFAGGQSMGSANSWTVDLGDLDGDGDLDAFVVNINNEPNEVWINTGGVMVDSGQALGGSNAHGVSLGDIDGDGDLDALTTHANYQPNEIWLNDGAGTMVSSGQSLGAWPSYDGELGDLDGDGDLDAFVATAMLGHRVWMNEPQDVHRFCIQGTALGGDYSWNLEGGAVNHTELNAPGSLVGSSSAVMAAAFAATINAAPLSTVSAIATGGCFEVLSSPLVELTVGQATAVPSCPVNTLGCVY